jgi:anti-sigma factor RsiW
MPRNAMGRHIAESDLALFVSGDLSMWRYSAVCLHIAGCEACRARIELYRQSRQSLKQAAAEMPAGVNWDRLAAEMTANIRVGLAAGECVAPRRRKPVSFFGWKFAAVAGGVVCVLSAAWWLNLPSSDSESLARSLSNVAHSLVTGGRPGIPIVEDRGSSAQGASGQQAPGPQAVVQVSTDSAELKGNGVPVSVPQEASRPASPVTNSHGSATPANQEHDYLTVTVALSGPAPNTKIDLPKDKDSPVTLVSYDSGNTRVTSRGSAYLVAFHPTLSLRNSSAKRVRSVALTIVASEISTAGKASVSVPSLDVAPGDTFAIHIDQALLSPASGDASGQPSIQPSIKVQLDGVLFEDLSFYGPDKLHLQHNMTVWELQAREVRQYFKKVLEASGRQALQTEMLESIARQADVPQPNVQMTPGSLSARSTNADAGQDMQFAFLRLPDTPVELSGGLARVSANEASAPHFTVRNISKRPVRHLEIGWILKDQDGREFLAASLPADVSLAPGQSSQVTEDASLHFSGHSAIQSMRGFISSAEFTDGSYWIPSRRELDDPQLRRVIAPSPEEQRLSQIYNKKGLIALIEELKKF